MGVALVEVADPGGHLQSDFAFHAIKFIELRLHHFTAIGGVEGAADGAEHECGGQDVPLPIRKGTWVL